jgi:hypothetical protein
MIYMKSIKATIKNLSAMNIFLSMLMLIVFILSGPLAYGSDFRHFYGVVWRGDTVDNLIFARQMGYKYVAHRASYSSNANANGLKFYYNNPEIFAFPATSYSSNGWVIKESHEYSSAEQTYFLANGVQKTDGAENWYDALAEGWHYTNDEFTAMWDFQQQSIIDYTVETIIAKIKSYENPSINYTFAGLMWDVPDLQGDFWTGWSKSGGKFVDLSYWTGEDSCVSSNHQHDYHTYSDGKAAFFKQLYQRVREEFPDAKFISEPFLIYDRWIKEIEDRPDAADLMPDMLTQESSGTAFVDDSRIFESGLISKNHVGLTAPNTFGEYENRLSAAKAAINGSWFAWYGRFGGSGDMPDYANIYEVPARLQLIRVLPNWDNLVNIPLTERAWDGNIYRSPNSYADTNIIYSRHPETDKIFVVFLNTSGKIKLLKNETVRLVNRTNGLFIETQDGSNDIQITDNEISLINAENAGKGYIITTNRINLGDIPSQPKSLNIVKIEG